MNVTPLLLAPDVNHRVGRNGLTVRAIVVHISTSTLDSMTSWFNDPEALASAHYGVARDGSVVQYVDEGDTAFHAGRRVRPTAPLVLEVGGNPNEYTIGIEHEGKVTDEPTEAQLEASAELIREIAARWGFPIDARHIIEHREIRADKDCPGKIKKAELVLRASGRPVVAPPPPPPAPAAAAPGPPPPLGEWRWSPFFAEWIMVTRYVSDADWSFVRLSDLRAASTPGTSPLSRVPRRP